MPKSCLGIVVRHFFLQQLIAVEKLTAAPSERFRHGSSCLFNDGQLHPGMRYSHASRHLRGYFLRPMLASIRPGKFKEPVCVFIQLSIPELFLTAHGLGLKRQSDIYFDYRVG